MTFCSFLTDGRHKPWALLRQAGPRWGTWDLHCSAAAASPQHRPVLPARLQSPLHASPQRWSGDDPPGRVQWADSTDVGGHHDGPEHPAGLGEGRQDVSAPSAGFWRTTERRSSRRPRRKLRSLPGFQGRKGSVFKRRRYLLTVCVVVFVYFI